MLIKFFFTAVQKLEGKGLDSKVVTDRLKKQSQTANKAQSSSTLVYIGRVA
jgi:hypothetical protein